MVQRADALDHDARQKGESGVRLNPGQRDSVRAIASRIPHNGVLIADEVGMGKTRIAVEVARCVAESGGRVAILVPPGLGYQWQAELRDGGMHEVQPILRSIRSYLSAWEDGPEGKRPWFELQTVMVSHAFTNWRFGESSHCWRWALLPELYARWREATEGRLPRYYHDYKDEWLALNAAKSIADAVPRERGHPARRLLDLLLNEVQWSTNHLYDGSQYSSGSNLRQWLERCVGAGLGVFDLVIVDEAHKSRGSESGLSRLVNNVVVSSAVARRLALTATPVELDVMQWADTLQRLGLPDDILTRVTGASQAYAEAVKRVRHSWRTSEEARAAFKAAASAFEQVLTPYLLRRDKREDADVKRFHKVSGLPINAYRRETEVLVETSGLSEPWRMAICAAESLSVVTRQADDPIAKRLRLTLGSGHGIVTLLDSVKRSDDDAAQEASDVPAQGTCREGFGADAPNAQIAEAKRAERAAWWLNVLRPAFSQGDNALFDHPGITAAIQTIEEATARGEKVLVFGRFVRPLRALVDLLNAREMLRRMENGESWPQSKVHDAAADNEWPAVRAAHRQLACTVARDTINDKLRVRYDQESRTRERFRDQLIAHIEQGLRANQANGSHVRMCGAFRDSVNASAPRAGTEPHALTLVARAMMELTEHLQNLSPSHLALLFCQLMDAVSDKDEGDHDREMSDEEVAEHWASIEQRLHEEYSRTQGGFARLMYGGTSVASRRMIQLAFNRPNSFPRVLVAQSMVGREGLNLHRSCRLVVILHPEWNPGVVEQQIGRVDRVGSHWCKVLDDAICQGTPAYQLPRIEIYPVIFRGTYDEYNWQVLRRRWDDLRAQLHGVVIPPSEVPDDYEGRQWLQEIAAAAPNFSPSKEPRT
jgi:hypothetical protein